MRKTYVRVTTEDRNINKTTFPSTCLFVLESKTKHSNHTRIYIVMNKI